MLSSLLRISSATLQRSTYWVPVATPIVIVGLVAGFINWRTMEDYRILADSVYERNDLRTQIAHTALSTMLERNRLSLRELAIAQVAATHAHDASALAVHLALIPYARSLLMTDAAGRITVQAGVTPFSQDVVTRDFFQVHANAEKPLAEMYVSKPFAATDGEPSVMLSHAIVDDNGGFAGVVAISLPLQAWAAQLASSAPPAPGYMALYDRDGSPYLRVPSAANFSEATLSNDPGFQSHLQSGAVTTHHNPEAGKRIWIQGERLINYRSFDSGNLVLQASEDAALALAEWRILAARRIGAVVALCIAAVFMVILARRQQRHTLQASSRFAALVENSDDALLIVDRMGFIIYASPAVCALTGMAMDAVIGANIFRAVHADDVGRLQKFWQLVLDNQQGIQELSYRIYKKGVGWIHVEGRASAHFDTPGIEGGVLVFRDISDRKSAEESLRRNEENLRKAQQVAHLGSWRQDARSEFVEWSDETYHIYGIAPGTPITVQRWLAFTHPDDRELRNTEWTAALQGQGFDVGHRIRVNGEVLWVQEKADLVFDQNGNFLSATGTVQDVSAQHLAATQLGELLDFNEKIIHGAPTGIAVYRADGPCVMANEAMARIVGSSEQEVLRQNFMRIDWWRHTGMLDAALDALQRGISVRRRIAGTSSLPVDMTVEVELMSIMRQGTPHLLVVMNDVSEFALSEQALKDAMNLAEDASRSKSEFLANMSHEIRTPLNAVIGLAQLALDQAADATMRDYLRQMYTSSTTLLGIINDILDYSKIEASQLKLENNSLNIRDLTANFVGLFRLSAGQKNVQLLTEIADNVPARVLGDGLRLGQVLANLGSNALKFTEEGTVRLQIRCLGEGDPGTARLEFSVTDSGLGMSEEVLARLFQPFVQADGSTTRRYGGSGLGLTISRRLVVMMGGDISVTSKPGKGSRFSFVLPMALPEAADHAAAPAASRSDSLAEVARRAQAIAGATVLLVDDDELNRDVVRRILERVGLKVVVASDGIEALEQIEKHTLDGIVMDLQMPRMDGFEATRRIRAHPRLNALPVIAFTASVLITDREQSIAAGMNGFVSKPVNASDLVEALLQTLPARQSPAVDQIEVKAQPAPKSPGNADADLPRLIARLHQLQAKLDNNEFVGVAELGDLHARLAPYALEIGEKAEQAIARYDYASARKLLAELITSLKQMNNALPKQGTLSATENQ